jgi:hypothetical protein
VRAANGDGDADTIVLPARTYEVTSDEITISTPMAIIGESARTTSIQGDQEFRLLHIQAGSDVTLESVTVSGGNAGSEDGGNILNAGDLQLIYVHLTDGHAGSGGGAATVIPGSMTVFASLIDDNFASSRGGGLSISGPVADPGDQFLGVEISTITNNGAELGSGISSFGYADVSVLESTIAANQGAGINQSGQAPVQVYGSIVAANAGANCQTSVPVDDSGGNVDDHDTCAFRNSGSRHDVDARIAVEVSNQGGQTDVLPINQGSPAIDLVNPCVLPVDQRFEVRVADVDTDACDAGAYELTPLSAGGGGATIESGTSTSADGSASFTFSSSAPGATFECRLDGPAQADVGTFAPCTSPRTYTGLAPGSYVFQVRQAGSSQVAFRQFSVAPAQVAQIPTPTPTPVPTATPVPQQSVAGRKVSGTVLVKLPGGKFAPLDPTKPIPNGSEIDTTKGKIELTAQLKKGGALQKATFYDGIFIVKSTKTTTDLTLSQPLAKCSKKAGAAAKKPKTRKLWGDGSGSFRTRGQYSAATVRGTRWLVQDSCAGTLTKVAKGVVSVFDNVKKKKKKIVLRSGKSYLAKPRR